MVFNHVMIELGNFIEMKDLGKYTWSRDTVTNDPSLVGGWTDVNYGAISDDIKEFERLQYQFYFSDNSIDIHKKLLEIVNRYDACPYQILHLEYKGSYDDCGNYYYAIGFAAELAKDENSATKMYAKILDLYPTHPMALLARKKLTK